MKRTWATDPATILLIAAAACASPTSLLGQSGREFRWEGRWMIGGFGVVDFGDSGPGADQAGVVAIYESGDSKIYGSARGVEVSGYWVEPYSAVPCKSRRSGSVYWGHVYFRAAPQTGTLEGFWTYCDNPYRHDITGEFWAAGPERRGASYLGWSGTWYVSSFGNVRFADPFPPDGVYGFLGTYRGSDGYRLYGRVVGRKIEGYWVHVGRRPLCDTARHGSSYYGTFEFEADADFGTLVGAWEYCELPPRHNRQRAVRGSRSN